MVGLCVGLAAPHAARATIAPQQAAAAHAKRTAPAPAVATETLLAISLNRVLQADALRVLVQADGSVALGCDDWDALNLARPATAADWQHADRCWRPLSALAALAWRVDGENQALVIDAPPTAFTTSRVTAQPAAAPVGAAARWGGFANYDLQWQRSSTPIAGSRTDAAHALLELGSFGPYGSGRITGLARDDGMQPRFVRLDSTWTHDVPQQMASLRIGDAIGRAGGWGRAMRFAGVQWATDFAIQPGFLSFPLPSMRGEAALPSTVDVYVNNSRRLQRNVPAGPFELTDLPVITGSGQVRVVVRDLLGREQVIMSPYYGSPVLLRPGLHAFSYEAGAVRENYGLDSTRYGKVYASATDRLGITDGFTREWRAELLGRDVAAGATGMWLLGGRGIGSLSAVASHAAGVGSGALGALGLDYQGTRWNSSLQLRGSTRRFSQAGGSPDGPTRLQATLAAGGVIGGTSLGISVIAQHPWQGEPQRLVSASLSHALGQVASLGLFALCNLVDRSTTVSLSLSVALDGRTSASLNSTRGRDRPSAVSTQLQLQRGVRDGRGFGFNLLADQTDARLTAQATQATDVAEFTAGVSRSSRRDDARQAAATSTDWRAGVSGGVAWLDDSVFLSRRIDGGFAVVEVDDYPDVQVLHDHRRVARTDLRGRALVPGLRGYEPNRISVDAADLPFDANVDALEVEVTPPARSGVIVRIPVQRRRSANLRLEGADGRALPVGSVLETGHRGEHFPVGFEGRAFVSGLAARTPITVRWPGGECSAVLVLAADADDAPELGVVRCQ